MIRTVALAFVLLAAGCGAGDATPTTEPPTPSTTTSVAPATSAEAAPDLGACMRGKGIAVGETSLGEEGASLITVDFLNGNDLGDPELQDALDECVDELQDLGIDISVEFGPEVLEDLRRQLREYADCMREHGVDDWPDPIADFTGKEIPFPLLEMGVALTDADFGAANEICEDLVVFSVF